MNSNKLKPFIYYSVNGNQLTTDPYVMIFETRNPTPQDVNYPQQKQWLNTTNNKLWVLTSFNNTTGTLLADWTDVSSAIADVNSLTGDDLVPVTPVNNNIDLIGSATGAFETAAGGSGIMEGSVRVDGVTVTINGSNQLVASGGGGIPTTLNQYNAELKFSGVASDAVGFGNYYRFGNVVFLNLFIDLGTATFPLPVGDATVTLPIPVNTVIPSGNFNFTIYCNWVTMPPGTGLSFHASAGANRTTQDIELYYYLYNPILGIEETIVTDAQFNNTSTIGITGFYFCDPAAP